MPSRSIHVITAKDFLPSHAWIIPDCVYMCVYRYKYKYHIFTHSSVVVHLACFHILAILNIHNKHGRTDIFLIPCFYSLLHLSHKMIKLIFIYVFSACLFKIEHKLYRKRGFVVSSALHLFKKNNFWTLIYKFFAVLVLHCCAGFSLVAASGSYLRVVVRGFSLQWFLLLCSTGSWVYGLQ